MFRINAKRLRFLVALLLGLKRRSLIEVALAATAAAYVTSLLLPLL